MESTTLVSIADRLQNVHRRRSCRNENYLAGRHGQVYVPQEATKEYRALAAKANANFIALVVRSLLQDLKLTAYRHENTETAKKVWDAWKRQGMVQKSVMAIRHAAVHGHAYTALLPTVDRNGYRWTTVVLSPHEVIAEWDDEINDARPYLFATRMPGNPDLAVIWEDRVLSVLDLTSRQIVGTGSTSALFFGDTEPVVRYVSGDWIVHPQGGWATTGEVELLLAAQDRLSQAIMDLLLVQTFGAVVLRWASGLEAPSEGSIEEERIRLAADRFLIFESPDSKAGTLSGTQLEPFIRNVAAALETFVMLSQSSPTRFMSKIENVGNDAILTAREPYEAKLSDYRETFGAQFEGFARAVAVAEGLGDPGPDGYFTWRATELRTLAELMDAVVKAASAGLNAEPLIRRNLTWGTEEQDQLLDGFQRRREEGDPATQQLVGMLGRQTEPARIPAGASQTGAGVPATT